MALNGVMSFSEAAKEWHLCDGSALRKRQLSGFFHPHEIAQSGGVWLITEEAMIRVFGPKPQSMASRQKGND